MCDALFELFPEVVRDERSRLKDLIPGQASDPRPGVGRRRTHVLVDHGDLVDFIGTLEDWMLGEKLKHNTPGTNVSMAHHGVQRNTHPADHISTSGP